MHEAAEKAWREASAAASTLRADAPVFVPGAVMQTPAPAPAPAQPPPGGEMVSRRLPPRT